MEWGVQDPSPLRDWPAFSPQAYHVLVDLFSSVAAGRALQDGVHHRSIFSCPSIIQVSSPQSFWHKGPVSWKMIFCMDWEGDRRQSWGSNASSTHRQEGGSLGTHVIGNSGIGDLQSVLCLCAGVWPREGGHDSISITKHRILSRHWACPGHNIW